MKNKFILTLAFVGGFVQLLQAEPKDKPLKIGYVGVEYIFSLLPESKRIESDARAFEQQLRKNLEKKVVEIQDKMQLFEKGYETMSEAVRKQKETELKNLQASFQQLQIEAQESLGNKQVELLKPIYEKIQQTVQTVAEENGYTHVFNTDVGGGVSILIYAEPKDNITDLVLKKLGITAPKEKETEKQSGKKVAKKGTEK